MTAARQFTSCLLGEQWIGISVDAVQEVTSAADLTRVPLAPPIISGLLNLRGEIITAIDLRRALHMPERPVGHAAVNLVLRTDERPIGVLVDEVGDVLEAGDDRVEPPPRTLRGPGSELIAGVYKLEDRLVLIVDTGALLAAASEQA
jgi:purine-binding chemotaxis protein CheW